MVGVPELPDLRILAEAFTAALVRTADFAAATSSQPLVLRGTLAELRGFEGRRLLERPPAGQVPDLRPRRPTASSSTPCSPAGSGLATPGHQALQRDRGRAHLRAARGRACRERRLAAWTPGADWLPPDEGIVELRYRDPKRMGKVYVAAGGVCSPGRRRLATRRAPTPTIPRSTSRRGRHASGATAASCTTLLKNQAFVAGIGNAYSDEILWAARLAPFRKRASLADEESERLWRAMP